MQNALSIPVDERRAVSGLSLGKVSSIYPESNMVDIVLFDGTVFQKVQVLSGYASSRSGISCLPIPEYKNSSNQFINLVDKNNPLGMAGQTENDIFVVVGYLGGYLLNPVVIGFLFPEDCEVLCGRDSKGNEDGSMFLWKHESNVYVRVAKGYEAGSEDRDGAGGTQVTPDIEISHPSGTFIKIGQFDYNKDHSEQRAPITNWDSVNQIREFQNLNPITKKADPAPVIIINHSSGTYVVIEASGAVFIKSESNLGIEVLGEMTEEVTGNLTRTYHGNVIEVIDGTLNQTVTGKVTQTYEDDLEKTVSGDVTEDIDGKLDLTIGDDVTETLQGDVTKNVTGDVTQNITGKETDTITGAWQRTSSTSIKDSAPSVKHNG
jgi:hypothetical protein